MDELEKVAGGVNGATQADTEFTIELESGNEWPGDKPFGSPVEESQESRLTP